MLVACIYVVICAVVWCRSWLVHCPKPWLLYSRLPRVLPTCVCRACIEGARSLGVALQCAVEQKSFLPNGVGLYETLLLAIRVQNSLAPQSLACVRPGDLVSHGPDVHLEDDDASWH
jgi:hypothetical protein